MCQNIWCIRRKLTAGKVKKKIIVYEISLSPIWPQVFTVVKNMTNYYCQKILPKDSKIDYPFHPLEAN